MFHFLTPTGILSSDLGGILPAPLTITGGVMEYGTTIFTAPTPTGISVMVDGKTVDVTAAVSGSQRYLIVEPGDYPTDAMGRAARRAASAPRK